MGQEATSGDKVDKRNSAEDLNKVSAEATGKCQHQDPAQRRLELQMGARRRTGGGAPAGGGRSSEGPSGKEPGGSPEARRPCPCKCPRSGLKDHARDGWVLKTGRVPQRAPGA